MQRVSIKNRLAAVIVALACAAATFIWTPCAAQAAETAERPFVLRVTDAVAPGELVTINGEFLTKDAAVLLCAPGADIATAVEAEIVQVDERNSQYLVFRMPSEMSGVCDLYVRTAAGDSDSYVLNGARPLFLSEFEVWEGQRINVSGRNFQLTEFCDDQTAPLVRLVKGTDAVAMTVTEYNPYRIEFEVPAGTPTGEYAVEISNGQGAYVGLNNGQTLTVVAVGADPLNLGVAWARNVKWNNRIDVVADRGADPTGAATSIVTTPIFQQASYDLQRQGGGVLYVPDGTYKISYLELPDNVVMVGESEENTKLLYYGTGSDFITYNYGSRSIGYNGLANLTLMIKYEDIEERPQYVPDRFVSFGDWVDGRDSADYNNEGYFVKNVSILSAQGRPQGFANGQQRGFAMMFTGNRILLDNVTTRTYSGIGFSNGDYCTVRDSDFTYSNAQFNILNSYSFLLNCNVRGERKYNDKTNQNSMHGMMCRDNIHFENNDISGMGAYTNDGEVICVEVPGGNIGMGEVASATSTTVTLKEGAASIVDRVFEYADLAVVITDGRGKGQMRYAQRPVGDSLTVTVNEPWDVVPDETSMVSLLLPNERVTVYNNRGSDCAKAILLFGNVVDAVAANNTLVDTDGIVVWSATSGTNVLPFDAFINIKDNDVSGASSRTHNTSIGVTAGRFSTLYGDDHRGDYTGTMIYGVDIRGNTITGDPSITQEFLNKQPKESEAPRWQGISVDSCGHSTIGPTGDGVGDVTNVVIQNNTIKDCRQGVWYTWAIDGMVVTNTKFENINGNPYYTESSMTTLPTYNRLIIPNQYTVTFEANGGTPVTPVSVKEGDLIQRPQSSKLGYALEGWYTDADYGQKWTFFTDLVMSNTRLYAKWVPETCTITYQANGGTVPEGAPTGYSMESETIQLGEPTRVGYTFAGWYTDEALSGTAVTEIPTGSTGNKTFYAKWIVKTYSVTYELNGGTLSDPATQYTVEDTVPLGTPVREGYTFGGWYESADLTGTAVTEIPAGTVGNKTYYANWTSDTPVTPSDKRGCGASLTVILSSLFFVAVAAMKIR